MPNAENEAGFTKVLKADVVLEALNKMEGRIKVLERKVAKLEKENRALKGVRVKHKK